jgi:hypothetical protein
MHPFYPFNPFNICKLGKDYVHRIFSSSINHAPTVNAQSRHPFWIYQYWNQALKVELLGPGFFHFIPIRQEFSQCIFIQIKADTE